MKPASNLKKWNLARPVEIDRSRTSTVYRVRQHDGAPAVLKCLTRVGVADERQGAALLEWYGGDGAVRLIAADEAAHLLEFADGSLLSDLARDGRDDEASYVICNVVERLHGARVAPAPSDLTPLRRRFRTLFEKAESDRKAGQVTLFVEAARCADVLLREECLQVPLHGDLHHDNIMHSSARGWLAIDPKGLIGDPCYDVANIFCNPVGAPEITANGRRIGELADRFAVALGQDQDRIRRYAFAHAALSSTWTLLEGGDPAERMDVAALIAQRL